jgi:hypothetical protein
MKDINLSSKNLTKLPDNLPQKVIGDFLCHNNKLTTLEASPKIVKGDFMCIKNKLTSLRGGPKKVIGNFSCTYNKLISLEGGPKYVGGRFHCENNYALTILEIVKFILSTKIEGRIYSDFDDNLDDDLLNNINKKDNKQKIRLIFNLRNTF